MNKYELIEELPFHDHYTIAYCESIKSVYHNMYDFVCYHPYHGPLHVVVRGFSDKLNCVYGRRLGRG